jgi:hypothetical protein
MKKRCFLSKNRRYINKSTKKRGRKSKGSKNSKRVKKVNTNIRKNKTKKGRRNIQKGGVWYKVRQHDGITRGNETVLYDLNENDPNNVTDLDRTWREYVNPKSSQTYYVNAKTGLAVWNLPSPNADFELKEVAHDPTMSHSSVPHGASVSHSSVAHGASVSHGSVPHGASVSHSSVAHGASVSHGSVPHGASVSHSSGDHSYNVENTDLSRISDSLFSPSISNETNEALFIVKLSSFVSSISKNPEYSSYYISKQLITRGGTILYAACRTPYVSLLILNNLIGMFKCSPHIKTHSGFYPLGALMSSLRDNIIQDTFLNVNLLRKYIEAIKILIAGPPHSQLFDSIIKYKNKYGFTGYDDFATMGIYNSIEKCKQLNEICKLLLIDPKDREKQHTTVLFEACNASNIYPELIQRLIDCGNDVNQESIILSPDDSSGRLVFDESKSGYPITALIKSYNRIIKEKGDPTTCKQAIAIVSQSSDMTKIPNYTVIKAEIEAILGT